MGRGSIGLKGRTLSSGKERMDPEQRPRRTPSKLWAASGCTAEGRCFHTYCIPGTRCYVKQAKSPCVQGKEGTDKAVRLHLLVVCDLVQGASLAHVFPPPTAPVPFLYLHEVGRKWL